MLFSEAKAKLIACFVVTTVVLVVCILVVVVYCGLEHEKYKFRNMCVTMVLTLLFQVLLWEPIRFIVLAIDHATWPQEDKAFTAEHFEIKPSHFAYLENRLQALRYKLQFSDIHHDEALNQMYKRIHHDLLLYGAYFVALMLLVLVGGDSSLYYSKSAMERLFRDNTSITMGLSAIHHRYQIPDFLKITIVNAFHADVYGHHDWWAMEQWKRMGVVRLRQLRTENTKVGLDKPVWANTMYAPYWEHPYKRRHYVDKFWLILDPFRPIDVDINFLDWLLLKFDHYGELSNYPELCGYVTFLMDAKEYAHKQIDYLRVSNWIDRRTWALFVDFSLYNADANMFTVVTLEVENTPFGTQLSSVEVECAHMILSPGQFSKLELFVLVLYVIIVIQCIRELMVKLWYDPKIIKEAWNLVDLVLCLLNVFMVSLWFVDELDTVDIVEKVRLSTKSEYMPFLRPMRLDILITIVKGFLVCITTMRLWKILQFAYVFQHFTRTLSKAWQAILSLGLIIVVFLMSIGIALSVPNGNNATVFRHVMQAIVTVLWYSVGFRGGITPKEFFHGGVVLGLIMYLVLVFLVAILLMNVFAAVIYDSFDVTRRELKEQRRRKRLSFLQFLRAEYADLMHRCPSLWSRMRPGYRSNNRTVAQNVALRLEQQEQEQEEEQMQRSYKPKPQLSDAERHAEYLTRVRRSFSLMAVLQVQMELLDRLLFGDEFGNLPTPPETASEDEDFPEMYREEERHN